MNKGDLEGSVGRLHFCVRSGCLYTEDGLWLAPDENRHVVRIGLTDYRQQTGGDITYVELPERGMAFDAGEDLADIEADNTDVSLTAPCSGTVMALNGGLNGQPDLINHDPYGEGWLLELKPVEWPVTAPTLLDATTYLRLVSRRATDALTQPAAG
jgi:glycine cleavage system H protein